MNCLLVKWNLDKIGTNLIWPLQLLFPAKSQSKKRAWLESIDQSWGGLQIIINNNNIPSMADPELHSEFWVLSSEFWVLEWMKISNWARLSNGQQPFAWDSIRSIVYKGNNNKSSSWLWWSFCFSRLSSAWSVWWRQIGQSLLAAGFHVLSARHSSSNNLISAECKWDNQVKLESKRAS